MEAKLIGCFEATNQTLWLRNFISSLKIINNINRSLRIYYDNSVGVLLSKHDNYSKSTKYIDIKYLSITEEVPNNDSGSTN